MFINSVCRKKDRHIDKAVNPNKKSVLCHEMTVSLCDIVTVYLHEVIVLYICMVSIRHRIFCLKYI